MTLRVTVEDIETGQTESREVAEGDYVLIAAEPAYLDGVQAYKTTHVLTVKGLVRGVAYADDEGEATSGPLAR